MRIRTRRTVHDFLDRPLTQLLWIDFKGLFFHTLLFLLVVFIWAMLEVRLTSASAVERFGRSVQMGVFLVTWLVAMLWWASEKFSHYVLVPAQQSRPVPAKPQTAPAPALSPTRPPAVPASQPAVVTGAVAPAPPGPVPAPPVAGFPLPDLAALVAPPTAAIPATGISPVTASLTPNSPPEAGPKPPPDTVPAPAAGRLPDVPPPDHTVSERGSPPFEPDHFAVASLATPDQPYAQVRLDPGRLSQALHQLPGLAGAIADFINTRQGHAL